MTHWLLLAALHLGAAQLQLGLREENRLGFVPQATNIEAVQPPNGTVTTLSLELKPFVRLRLLTHDTELTIRYQPQLLLTEAFGQHNSLFLNTGTATLTQRLARRTSLAMTATGTAGRLDFFRAQRVLQESTDGSAPFINSFPLNQVIGYASFNGYAGLAQQIGRSGKLEVGGLGLYTGPAPGEGTFTFFRRQTQVGAAFRYSDRIGRDDIGGVDFEYRKVWFDHGPYYAAYTPALIWRHYGTDHFLLDSKAGVMFSTTDWGNRQTPDWLLGQGLLPPRTGFDHRIFPVFSVAMSGFEYRRPGFFLQSSGVLNLLPFYDPVHGVLQQRIGFGLNNQIIFSRLWRGRMNVQILIPAKWVYGRTQQPFIDQDVYATLNPALIRRITPITYFEVGTYITQQIEDYTLKHWYQPTVVIYIAFQGQSTVW